jgi:hypothetical protein
MLPGIERQPRKKLESSPERLLALLHCVFRSNVITDSGGR